MCIRDRSGPRLGNTNASTGRVFVPKVRSNRMNPKISIGEPSALLRSIDLGGTGLISVTFSFGCSFMDSLLMHGTSAAESIVISSTEIPFTLAATRTRAEAQDNAVGVSGYLASDVELYESKR